MMEIAQVIRMISIMQFWLWDIVQRMVKIIGLWKILGEQIGEWKDIFI